MFGVAISPHDPKVIVAGGDMGNAFMTRDGGRHWAIIGRSGGSPFGNPGYRGVWGVHFDPKRADRLWIGGTHGLYRSTDAGRTWQLVLGGGADFTVHAITTDPTDPDIVYAASGTGARSAVSWARGDVWKSTDGGRSWQTLRPSGLRERDPVPDRNWVTIAVDPQSPFLAGKGHQRVYLSGQGGLFVSRNAGETWQSQEASLPGGVVDLQHGGVHTSGISGLVLMPGEEQSTIFAAIQVRPAGSDGGTVTGGVYASFDGGQTWEARNHGLEKALAGLKGDMSYSLLAGSPTRPQVLYWACASGVYKTEDAGATWRQITDTAADWVRRPDFDGQEVWWLLRRHGGNYDQSYYNEFGPANGLACSPTDPQVVAVCDNAGIALSVDGGAHWTEPGFDYGAAYWPQAFGDRPPLRLTHKVRSRGIQLIVPRAVAVDPFDPKTIAIGHDDVGLTISRDSGKWWEWAYRGILIGERNNIHAIIYDPQVKGRMWAAGGGWDGFGHVNQSDDGGRTFHVIGIPQLTAEVKRSGHNVCINSLALDPTSPRTARTLYAGTDMGMFVTRDGGETWQGPAPGLAGALHVQDVLVDPTDPKRVYAAAGDGLYRSEDAGSRWRRVSPDRVGAVQSVSLCRATGTLYLLANRDRAGGESFWAARDLLRSDDHGETWRELTVTTPHGTCVGAHPHDPNRVYFMGFADDVRTQPVNVWRSTDGGHAWRPIADGIPLSPGGSGNRIVFDPTRPARFFVLHDSGTYEAVEH